MAQTNIDNRNLQLTLWILILIQIAMIVLEFLTSPTKTVSLFSGVGLFCCGAVSGVAIGLLMDKN